MYTLNFMTTVIRKWTQTQISEILDESHLKFKSISVQINLVRNLVGFARSYVSVHIFWKKKKIIIIKSTAFQDEVMIYLLFKFNDLCLYQILCLKTIQALLWHAILQNASRNLKLCSIPFQYAEKRIATPASEPQMLITPTQETHRLPTRSYREWTLTAAVLTQPRY